MAPYVTQSSPEPEFGVRYDPVAFPDGGFASTATTPTRPFYGPEFLFRLREMTNGHPPPHPLPSREGEGGGGIRARLDWKTGRLVVRFADKAPPLEDLEHRYRVIILGGDNRVLYEGIADGESLPAYLGKVRVELGATSLDFVECPISYVVPRRRDGAAEIMRHVVVYRAVSSAPLSARHPVSMGFHDAPVSVIGSIEDKIERAYIESRYSKAPDADVANDYSKTAMIQAFNRIHPHSADLREAIIRQTPVVASPLLAQLTGASEVWIKDESEQNTGSFKPRGALNRLKAYLEKAAQKERERAVAETGYIAKTESQIASETAVVAASHGNHAQGVVWAASKLGFAATLLVLPLHEQTQKIKIRQCLKLGAFVMLHGKNLDAAMTKAETIRREGLDRHLAEVVYLKASSTDEEIDEVIRQGQTAILYGDPDKSQNTSFVVDEVSRFPGKTVFVPTYDHAQVSVGQATDAMELIGSMPHLLDGGFIFAVGAGGLGNIAGAATYLREVNPNARVVGVNRTGVRAFARSLDEEKYSIRLDEIEAPEVATFADGVDVPRIGQIPFEQVQKLGGVEAARVTEDEIAEALVFALSQKWYGGKTKRVEGAPAAVMAALLNGALGNVEGQRVVLSVTGKNIDEATMQRALGSKKWVAENPHFYRFVCSLRTILRSDPEMYPPELLDTFNKLLADPEVLSRMIIAYANTDDPQRLTDRMITYLRAARISHRLFGDWAVTLFAKYVYPDQAGLSVFLDPYLGIEQLLPDGLEALGRGYTMIDVTKTGTEGLASESVDGAYHLPLTENFGRSLTSFSKESPLLFVSRQGARALLAAREARRLGYKKVAVLEGGIIAWNLREFLRVMQRHRGWTPVENRHGLRLLKDAEGRDFHVWVTSREKLVIRLVAGDKKDFSESLKYPEISEIFDRFHKVELMLQDGTPVPLPEGVRGGRGGGSRGGSDPRGGVRRGRRRSGSGPVATIGPRLETPERPPVAGAGVGIERTSVRRSLEVLLTSDRLFYRWLEIRGYRDAAKLLRESGARMTTGQKVELLRAVLKSRKADASAIVAQIVGHGGAAASVRGGVPMWPALSGAGFAKPVLLPIVP